jgi:hypothetical protein
VALLVVEAIRLLDRSIERAGTLDAGKHGSPGDHQGECDSGRDHERTHPGDIGAPRAGLNRVGAFEA